VKHLKSSATQYVTKNNFNLTMPDKSKELITAVKLVNDKLHFIGTVDSNQPVSIDYVPPLGDNLGYTSLELFLLSLSSCVGSSVLTFLRKMKKTISSCEIIAKGLRREEHPTCFKTIELTIVMISSDTSQNDIEKVIKLSEELYCPVLAMIKGNVEVEFRYSISADGTI
jgi:putative redox protein